MTETTRLTDPATLGAWIRVQRKSRGWTLEHLADRAGTGVRFVSECERGKESAELGKVMAVLRALGLELQPGIPSASTPVRSAPSAPAAPPTPVSAPAAPRAGLGSRPARGGDMARLWDMLVAAEEIDGLRAAVSGDALPVSRVVARRALERCFEVLGEAARRVTPAMQARMAHVPWRELVARRNRLVMEYERVDEADLLRAAREEIPALRAILLEILSPGQGDRVGQ